MAKKPNGPKATFKVLGRLRFDGDVCKPGDTVEMAAEDAAPLVAAGVLEAPAAAPEKPAAAPAK